MVEVGSGEWNVLYYALEPRPSSSHTLSSTAQELPCQQSHPKLFWALCHVYRTILCFLIPHSPPRVLHALRPLALLTPQSRSLLCPLPLPFHDISFIRHSAILEGQSLLGGILMLYPLLFEDSDVQHCASLCSTADMQYSAILYNALLYCVLRISALSFYSVPVAGLTLIGQLCWECSSHHAPLVMSRCP